MGGSSNTTNIINQTININVPPNAPNPPPQPFVDSLLNWLIELDDGAGPKVTGDPQKDLDEIMNLLLAVAGNKFNDTFGYGYNKGSSNPPNRAEGDKTFVNFDDFTNCPTIEEQRVANYLNDVMFGNDSIVPPFALDPMRDDLLVVLQQLLNKPTMEGWVTMAHKRLYRPDENSSGQLPIAVDAMFVYTIVSATDGNGDLTPTLFLFYIGGFYHGKSL